MKKSYLYPWVDLIVRISRTLEKIGNVKLTKDNVDVVMRDFLHVYIHEIAHQVISRSSWVTTLNDRERCFISEVMARFLEREVSRKTGLKVTSLEQQVREIVLGYQFILKDINLDLSHYKAIYGKLKKSMAKGVSLEECMKILLNESKSRSII